MYNTITNNTTLNHKYNIYSYLGKIKRYTPLPLFIFFISTLIHTNLHAQDITSYSYILQADAVSPTKEKAVKRIAALPSDLIILDATYTIQLPWTKKDIDTIRASYEGRHVVCYLSIGEAENYRPYWKKEWENTPPSWLRAENPQWKGNFKVAYWKKPWQDIISQSIEDIMAQGFDGVFLDIVDAFEFFEKKDGVFIDNRLNKQTNQSYRQDMAFFIMSIAQQVRQHNKKALIIPQNGIQLLAFPRYAHCISAQALEDLYTLNNKKQSKKHIEYILSFTHNNLALPVLTTEYPTKKPFIKYAKKQAEYYGTILLITNRTLQ